MSETIQRVGYHVPEFAEATSLGRTLVYRLIGYGKIPHVRIEGRIVITVSPADFLAKYEEIQGWLETYMTAQAMQTHALAELAAAQA